MRRQAQHAAEGQRDALFLREVQYAALPPDPQCGVARLLLDRRVRRARDHQPQHEIGVVEQAQALGADFAVEVLAGDVVDLAGHGETERREEPAVVVPRCPREPAARTGRTDRRDDGPPSGELRVLRAHRGEARLQLRDELFGAFGATQDGPDQAGAVLPGGLERV
jgi:hypothetical protein